MLMLEEANAHGSAGLPIEPLDWEGTARFEVLRCIGRGGMGAVYEARDREHRQRVALKTLLHFNPAALYLFKQEFRTLAGVHHPNLVRLHELVAGESDRVFFSMELVRGADFLTYVQRPGTIRIADGRSGVTSKEVLAAQVGQESGVHEAAAEGGSDTGRAPSAGRTRRTSPADFDRLRPALRQLVEGVHALHSNRKLHRDIKPSNVLVTAEGRVVLLDFGVSTELPRVADEALREDGQFVGTARYMAPEQAFEDAPAPAADWYSVGVVLYEALVGAPPFSGPVVDVIHLKTTADSPPPSECVDGVPRDLDELCLALLERVPEKRPGGSEILRRLGGARNSILAPSPLAEARSSTGLVGRERQLRALREAFGVARGGRSVTVRVCGRAGMGKSALIQHALDELVEQGEAVVLRGRAYERESVPYKAVDSVIDALSGHLMHVNDLEGTIVSPKDTWALARLFPVLRRVPCIGEVAEEPITDPQGVRRRAFAALRELLASLSSRRPMVIYIDDVQWGDTDSAALLLELVRPPYAPPVMFVLAYREEDAQTAPFLTEVNSHWPSGANVRDVVLGPLDTEEARRLALGLLGSNDEAARNIAEAIGRESGGSPFLVEELARSAVGKLSEAHDAKVTLEQMVGERLAGLPQEARRLVEIIAVGGRPLPVSTVGDAARVEAADELVTLLQRRHFVRPGLRNGREVVESVHDRIRETIVAQLSADSLREHHGNLARALQATLAADPESVALHLIGAGETERGALFAERAAEQAAKQLAFEQAARLFRLTLDTFPATSADGSRLRKRLGEVLEWTGRSAEAGRAYLEAAEGASALQKVDLQRAAAEQFHASGLMDEGTRVLHSVLAAVGERAPRSSRSALFWLVVYHLWLRVVGVHFRERDAQEVSPEDRLRIDALYAVALGLTLVNHILGVSMKARALVAALRGGDRLQVSRAAALVACDLGGAGGPQRRTERDLWQIAERLAQKEQNPAGKFAVRATTGITLFMRGRWREARDLLDPIQAMTTNRRVGQQSAVLFTLYSLYFLGDVKELTQRYTRLVAEAEDRRNVFMSVNVRTSSAALVWLAADDPERARRELREAMAQWTQGKFSSQEWRATMFGADIDLYVGDAASAYERVRGLARALKKNFFIFVQYVRAMTAFVQGRCAIASLEVVPAAQRGARLSEARRLRRRLEREQMPWTSALASILAAGIARTVGDRRGAETALRAAIDGAEATEMAIHGAAARYQLGLLLGGDEGAELVRDAVDVMTTRGVRAPERFAAMLVPGPFRSDARNERQ
jgi:eukaryotic-like serine/threonine-protein kinase